MSEKNGSEALHTAVSAANKNRGHIYLHLLEALEARFGKDEAAAVMRQALVARGRESASSFSEAARTGDLEALAREFVARGQNDGDVFGRGCETPEGSAVTLVLHACPLVQAWRERGLSPERVERLCDIACGVDYGKFEGMGYTLRFDSQIGCGDTTCRLVVGRPEGK